jgi:predicted nuclease of predicted toxin-antitoxin system
VRRVLLDENLPRKLRRELLGFAVRTVQEEGWTSFRNGELLSRAQHSFEVLLTADRRLQLQQNIPQFDIGVVVIVTMNLRLRTILTAIEKIRTALEEVRAGEVITVTVTSK